MRAPAGRNLPASCTTGTAVLWAVAVPTAVGTVNLHREGDCRAALQENPDKGDHDGDPPGVGGAGGATAEGPGAAAGRGS